MKLLWILLLVLVLVWWFKGQRRRPARPPARPDPAPPAVRPQLLMVRCAHCGAHLPADEAVQDPRGRSYCDVAHRDAGAAGR